MLSGCRDDVVSVITLTLRAMVLSRTDGADAAVEQALGEFGDLWTRVGKRADRFSVVLTATTTLAAQHFARGGTVDRNQPPVQAALAGESEQVVAAVVAALAACGAPGKPDVNRLAEIWASLSTADDSQLDFLVAVSYLAAAASAAQYAGTAPLFVMLKSDRSRMN